MAPADRAADRERSRTLWLAVRFESPAPAADNPSVAVHDLEGIALRFLAITPRISLEPPQGVLLEVGGSVRLFGGVRPLHRAVRHLYDSAAPPLHHPADAIAPTPRAAWLLARARSLGTDAPVHVCSTTGLATHLHRLSIHCADPAPAEERTLSTLGVHTLQDLAALPRSGLRRRGLDRLHRMLEQARGELPEPRTLLQLPEAFQDREVLDPIHAQHGYIRVALDTLLERLARFLRRRDQAIETLEVRLIHRHPPPTHRTVGFLEPTRDSQWMGHLVHEQLDRHVVDRPIEAVELHAPTLTAFQPLSPGLPWAAHHTERSIRPLVERLTARLGPEQVRRLTAHGHPLPESAWRSESVASMGLRHPDRYSGRAHAPHTTGLAHPGIARPLWLLPAPRPLHCQQEQPYWHGPLALEYGPERVEGGWWATHDVARDYYIARSPAGPRLWIFRSLRVRQSWYLHGLFS